MSSQVPLKDLCSTITETRSPAALLEGSVWYFSIPAFDGGGRPALEQPKNIASSKLLLNRPCLLFSRLNPRIPRVWDLTSLPLDYPCLASTEFVPFVIEDECRLHPRYLYWFLQSRAFVARARAGVRAATKSRERVQKEALFEIPVPLPPLAEQRRNVAMLDKADGVRRKWREAIGLLDELLRSAYVAMVGSQNEDYVNWPQCQVADLAEAGPQSMRTGPFGSALRHSEFVDAGVAVLGIDNAVQNRFSWGERRFITAEKYEKFRRYTVKPGDVIITIMGTTGRSAVIPEDISTSISTKHLAVVTVNREKVHPEFLSHAIHSDPALLSQIAAANRGAIMAGLNLGLIKRLRLRLPPLPIQCHFAALVVRVSQAEERFAHACVEAEHLYRSLAQRAFATDAEQ